MRIVITGASGNIGTGCVRSLPGTRSTTSSASAGGHRTASDRPYDCADGCPSNWPIRAQPQHWSRCWTPPPVTCSPRPSPAWPTRPGPRARHCGHGRSVSSWRGSCAVVLSAAGGCPDNRGARGRLAADPAGWFPDLMSVTSRTIPAAPEDVFAVLSDGWTFASWVVGASRIRDVDEHWPQPGARIQHSVGSWPLLLDDHTAVEEMTPHRMLQMRARGWPAGEARIRIELEEQGSGTLVTITEDAVSGPGLLVPGVLRDSLLDWRNVETLQRLAYRVEGETRRRA